MEYDWPFFDAIHQDFAARLRAWASAHLDAAEAGDAAAVDARCRSLVAALATGGWLDACAPEPGSASRAPEVRRLCLAREILAYHEPLADFAFAMQGLGSGPIALFGDDAQRATWLARVRAGAAISAFALSEPAAGSDVANIATRAEAEGDGFVLNGAKAWISNGGIADVYVVFARTGEAPGARGLSAFIVDSDAPGLRITERPALIAPHPIATLTFENCRVPASALLGERGRGFGIAMATLDVFRASVGAAALGMARRALTETLAHVRQREVFGAPLADLAAVRERLAHMSLAIETSALLVYSAAWRKDSGAQRVTREAAMAKLHATEQAQQVIDTAVQLFGARGVVHGNAVERLYRDIRALRIYEGASEIQLQIIARELLRQAGGE